MMALQIFGMCTLVVLALVYILGSVLLIAFPCRCRLVFAWLWSLTWAIEDGRDKLTVTQMGHPQ